MKKLFRIFVILCAAALMFCGCSSPNEEENPSPVITNAFYISGDAFGISDCMKVNALSDDIKFEALETLPIFNSFDDLKAQYPNSAPYFLCIICKDINKDIKTFDEISIPDIGMPVNEMEITEGFYLIPVGYSKDEIPDSKLVEGKYTFKFQAVDGQGNKSNVFSVTVGISE